MHPRVEELLKLPIAKQCSPEWFKDRQDKITSSVASGCLPRTKEIIEPWKKQFYSIDPEYFDNYKTSQDMSCSNYNTFFNFFERYTDRKKYAFVENEAIYWGKKYEQVVINYYMKKYDKIVYEIGLIPFPNQPYLGASPDGITDDGFALEIKCPKSRKINGIPPLEYWIQIQFHLQATQLEICHFIETSIREYNTFKEWESDYNTYASGILFQIEKVVGDSLKDREYLYMPPHYNPQHWVIEQLPILQTTFPNHNVVPVFFKLITVNFAPIKRDDNWFKQYALPHLKSAHEKIAYYKKFPKELINEKKLF